MENCYLSKVQIKKASQLSIKAGADFIKTSTGFGLSGAILEDLEIMKGISQDKIQIKAAGGIRDINTAKKYIEIGVTRLGTSSGVDIISKGDLDKTLN